MIVLSAFLTTAGLILLVRLPGMINSAPESITVEEANGIYALTGIKD